MAGPRWGGDPALGGGRSPLGWGHTPSPRARPGVPQSPPPLHRWVLLLRKGYQERDAAPRVAVVTKVKGAAAAEAAGRRLWDAADLTWPPQVRLGPGRGQGGHTCGQSPWQGDAAGTTGLPKPWQGHYCLFRPWCHRASPWTHPGVTPPLMAPSCFPGRKCALPGDQFHCHNPASPRHLPRGE